MSRLRGALAGVSPRTILVVGWLGLVLYAYPGYLSYDSVSQLLQARSGVYTGGHPPVMSALWGLLDRVIAGPLPMLLLQISCALVGAYLLLRRALPPRAAALGATLLLWTPPVATVLAVIWKDAQMVGYLLLGAALLGRTARRTRLAGLALLSLATAMRYNALAITFPLVLGLFVWSPTHRRLARLALATGAWLGITLAASLANRALTTPSAASGSLWHDTVALADITGTLRYAPDLPDEQLRTHLAGTPLRATTGIQAITRAVQRPDHLDAATVLAFGSGVYVPQLWIATWHVFDRPTTAAQRVAVARAWRAIVLGHPRAYLTYRAHVTAERLHLGGAVPPAAYVWFTDVLDKFGSGLRLEHAATPSRLQGLLQPAMQALGTGVLFRPAIYLGLALVLLALSMRRREACTLLLSGLANEAALFVLAPTIDYRYSIWLVIATLLVLVQRGAERLSARS